MNSGSGSGSCTLSAAIQKAEPVEVVGEAGEAPFFL